MYLMEMPCLALTDFRLTGPSVAFRATSSMTRSAYLPWVEILIISAFPCNY